MDPWPIISDLAAQQHGRVSARQLQAAGMDDATLSRLARKQRWARPHRGVYAPVGAVDSPHAALAEALLAVGPPVLVGGWSAAWLWGLVRTAPTIPELVVPHHRRIRRDGIVIRRSRTLSVSDGVIRDGLPVSTVVRLVCDLAALTNEEALRALLIDARQRRLVDLAEVAQRAAGMGTAAGMASLRQRLAELDGAHCDSVLEHRLRHRLSEVEGLPSPAPAPFPVETPGHTLHVDIAWPQWCVGIEADGFASHSQRASLDMDARRHNALQLAGWRVLRATWAHLDEDFGPLVQQLHALLN